MRRSLSVLLAWVLCGSLPGLGPRPLMALARSQATTQKPTLKERILEVAPGSMIEVRLKNKQRLRGRLGEVTDEAFTVKLAKGNKIEDRRVAFDDLKSLKAIEEGSRPSRTVYILAGVGIALAVLFVIGLVLAYNS